MNGLTHIEKQKLELELEMSGGNVLGFSNRTLQEFFREVVGVEIYDPRFNLRSGSKANRLRAFWQVASHDQLRLLFVGLLDGWSFYASTSISDSAQKLLLELIGRFGGRPKAVASEQKEIPASLGHDVSRRLVSRLVEVTSVNPQQRGYEFEKFFRELFDAYGLSARASFRLTGEQIDGSFVLHNETYLLEAKWQNAPTGAADLHIFEGKLREKAAWSRGLFVSSCGFTTDGLEAFGRGKRIVCMDGFDLSEMLRLGRPFVEIMEAKVRRAAETGNPFVSVRELFTR